MAFKCPACGQTMSELVGPNWTVIPAPAPAGQSVVILTCLNIKCGTPLGTYLTPS